MKFKVGDLIIGKAPYYRITNHKCVCRVMAIPGSYPTSDKIDDEDDIVVKVMSIDNLTYEKDYLQDNKLYPSFRVHSHYFKLYKNEENNGD